MAIDIVFLIPTTAVSGSRLRREYEEMEGGNVSSFIIHYLNVLHHRLMIYLK